MNIKIHRGTHQIGGCITEIYTEQARIFIDFGAELPDENRIPSHVEIDGVTTGKQKCDAVFFTHYHSDHLGLYKNILPDIPVYIGKTAKDIFVKLSERIDPENVPIIEGFHTFCALQRIQIGDISLTPLLIDHSAYDAYMFLVEAGGKRILHTGDFRLHGFRGNKTIDMLKKYATDIDVVITEGTSLSREDKIIDSERELQRKIGAVMNKYKYVFILCPSTNIDRIASCYQVNPFGRYFLCDHYQKGILDIVSSAGGKISQLYSFEKAKTYGDNLKDRFSSRGFCMIVRATPYFEDIISQYDSKETVIIYSMWNGYLKNRQIADFLEGNNIEHLHTSGHATRAAIHAVCEAVMPRQAIIPIHSDIVENICKLNLPCPIRILNDGDLFEM